MSLSNAVPTSPPRPFSALPCQQFGPSTSSRIGEVHQNLTAHPQCDVDGQLSTRNKKVLSEHFNSLSSEAVTPLHVLCLHETSMRSIGVARILSLSVRAHAALWRPKGSRGAWQPANRVIQRERELNPSPTTVPGTSAWEWLSPSSIGSSVSSRHIPASKSIWARRRSGFEPFGCHLMLKTAILFKSLLFVAPGQVFSVFCSQVRRIFPMVRRMETWRRHRGGSLFVAHVHLLTSGLLRQFRPRQPQVHSWFSSQWRCRPQVSARTRCSHQGGRKWYQVEPGREVRGSPVESSAIEATRRR